MSTVELRERVHQAIDALQEDQLRAVHNLLEAFRPSDQNRDDVSEQARRREILERVVARMKANPIPANAPRFTRDELHERR
jgi:hypothetical protein